MTTAEQITHEVEALHTFFVDWFNGSCSADDATFEARLASRLSDDFLYVMPGGTALTRAQLLSSLRRAHGSNPDFRITVHDVTLRFEGPDCLLATYTERQQGARNSEQSDNRRLSTVLFTRDGEQLRWHHIHETWMPAAR